MIRGNHVRCTLTEQGAILFDTERGKLYNLNGTAAHVWNLLDRCNSEDTVINAMVGIFPNVPKESITGDVNTVLKRFCNLKLLSM